MMLKTNNLPNAYSEVLEILKQGSAVAESKASETLSDVRKAMKINYFDGENLF